MTFVKLGIFTRLFMRTKNLKYKNVVIGKLLLRLITATFINNNEFPINHLDTKLPFYMIKTCRRDLISLV